jgi:two-component system nitrogen regulation sensor histidine kinase NtrY
VSNTLQASLEITNAYYKDHHRTAQHFGEKIREDFLRNSVFDAPREDKAFRQELERQREKYSLAALEVYWHPLDPRLLVTKEDLSPDVFARLPIDSVVTALAGQNVSIVQRVGTGDVLRSIIPLYRSTGSETVAGAIAVSYHVPVSLVAKATEISTTFEDYKKVNPIKYPIKSIYFSFLILITLVIIFGAIWAGLYLARELTVPLERLEKGVNEVGRGNFNVEVVSPGNDEISRVLSSFNKMTSDIRESRNRLESTNLQLEEKRRYVEAVLSNVSAGICSVDANFEITTINKSASTLLKLPLANIQGKSIHEVFTGELQDLRASILEIFESKSRETIFKYLNLVSEEGEPISILVNLTPLYDDGGVFNAMILVLDDITHLIKAQREAAWREVARRIAHEIKNPLTPIKLSAQRLQKKLSGLLSNKEDGDFLQECTGTIVRQVDELKEMVNEFSQYARLPSANPQLNDLNSAIAEVASFYQQAHRAVEFHLRLNHDLPVFPFDREQIKRVLINLLENAVSALGESKTKGIVTIASSFRPHDGIVLIEVTDNGPGISNQILPLLFEPYFSTKKEGTGLGLAIAKRIISDHDGYIRASSQNGVKDVGACFTIELPINRSGEVMHGS